MNTVQLPTLMEKWARIGLSKGWIEKWCEGAIYPREMVFFLARCEEHGITSVIESGRQDGYSTEILGEYARDQKATVYSIDYEEDAERARRCRERLKEYPELKLLRGDANRLIISTVRSIKTPTAILMDGPKGFWAMSLMFASAEHSSVRLLALHNLAVGEVTRDFFQKQIQQPAFYESFVAGGEYWQRFAAKEISFCEGIGAKRSLDQSSLGVMPVDDSVRQRLIKASHRKFKLYPPGLVRLGWKLGLDWPTSLLYDISHRIPFLV